MLGLQDLALNRPVDSDEPSGQVPPLLFLDATTRQAYLQPCKRAPNAPTSAIKETPNTSCSTPSKQTAPLFSPDLVNLKIQHKGTIVIRESDSPFGGRSAPRSLCLPTVTCACCRSLSQCSLKNSPPLAAHCHQKQYNTDNRARRNPHGHTARPDAEGPNKTNKVWARSHASCFCSMTAYKLMPAGVLYLQEHILCQG